MRTILAIAAAGILVAAAAGDASATPAIALPRKAQAFARSIATWAAKRQIPIPVLLAWIELESDFTPGLYGPEAHVMRSWVKDILEHPKWQRNPDYAKAVAIAEQLAAGADPKSLVHLWTFGSWGLMQVSRPSTPLYGYPEHLPNAGLLDPDTNLRVGTAAIAYKRRALFGVRNALTREEWAAVRAAYVMGTAGYKRNPDGPTALERKRRFYRALERYAPTPEARA